MVSATPESMHGLSYFVKCNNDINARIKMFYFIFINTLSLLHSVPKQHLIQ